MSGGEVISKLRRHTALTAKETGYLLKPSTIEGGWLRSFTPMCLTDNLAYLVKCKPLLPQQVAENLLALGPDILRAGYDKVVEDRMGSKAAAENGAELDPVARCDLRLDTDCRRRLHRLHMAAVNDISAVCSDRWNNILEPNRVLLLVFFLSTG